MNLIVLMKCSKINFQKVTNIFIDSLSAASRWTGVRWVDTPPVSIGDSMITCPQSCVCCDGWICESGSGSICASDPLPGCRYLQSSWPRMLVRRLLAAALLCLAFVLSTVCMLLSLCFPSHTEPLVPVPLHPACSFNSLLNLGGSQGGQECCMCLSSPASHRC